MATWTNIPDSVLEVGKPARSVDALALRDNPKAIAEGDSAAPRIQTALANETVSYAGDIVGAFLSAPGTDFEVRYAGQDSGTRMIPNHAGEDRSILMASGVFRIYATIARGGGGGTGDFRIRLNGTQIYARYSETLPVDTDVEINTNFSASKGDWVTLEVTRNGSLGGDFFWWIKNVSICSGNVANLTM
ncbi:hypothetical protein JHL22_04930 [Advenella sp. WQ 585]|uniref:Uncharacterized protein n=1 Tax=Advenella mandrilli TaxID=2800330 RepID=A0ABS1ED39_9BURK|nr:hypothetical protein [Advenella mandrilli]MBK1780554.1 hypothetical protein [Advenella mandrilli]